MDVRRVERATSTMTRAAASVANSGGKFRNATSMPLVSPRPIAQIRPATSATRKSTPAIMSAVAVPAETSAIAICDRSMPLPIMTTAIPSAKMPRIEMLRSSAIKLPQMAKPGSAIAKTTTMANAKSRITCSWVILPSRSERLISAVRRRAALGSVSVVSGTEFVLGISRIRIYEFGGRRQRVERLADVLHLHGLGAVEAKRQHVRTGIVADWIGGRLGDGNLGEVDVGIENAFLRMRQRLGEVAAVGTKESRPSAAKLKELALLRRVAKQVKASLINHVA